jgi:hypothetical protein
MRDSSIETKLILAAAAGLTLAAACKSNANDGAASNPTASATMPAKTDKACCKGLNDCKGKGGCAVEGKHSCAGQNDCKGQGGCNMHCPGK